MALKSMTGFARSEGSQGPYRWTLEVKSVNGRHLDVRLRLPNGYETLEPDLRQKVQARLKRGNLQAVLTVQTDAQRGRLVVNEEALAQVLALCREIAGKTDAAPPTIDGLLALRGVLEIAEQALDPDAQDQLLASLTNGFDQVLQLLVEARSSEGAHLHRILSALCEELKEQMEQAAARAEAYPQIAMERLKAQIAALLDPSLGLSEERLAQEVAVLVTRADVREELDRLGAHVSALDKLLQENNPVGRKMEFLVQEFHRETNTLCSKSQDKELTAIGLAMKGVIDQLREQVQNVE